MTEFQERLRLEINQYAQEWIGTSFHHQGRIKKSIADDGGCDCLGLIMGIAKKFSFKSRYDRRLLAEHDEINYSKYPQKNKLEEKLELHLTVVNRPYLKTADIGLFAISSVPQHIGLFDVNTSTYLIHSYQEVGYVSKHTYDNIWCSRLTKIFNFNELC